LIFLLPCPKCLLLLDMKLTHFAISLSC